MEVNQKVKKTKTKTRNKKTTTSKPTIQHHKEDKQTSPIINLSKLTSLSDYNVDQLNQLHHITRSANTHFISVKKKEIEKALITLVTVACLNYESHQRDTICLSSPKQQQHSLSIDDLFNKAYLIVSKAYESSHHPSFDDLYPSIYSLVQQYKLSHS